MPTLFRERVLHSEMLDPLIETTFEHMLAAGIVPPPPQELHGMDLNVNYVSMLAQAQRAIATNGVDRFVGNLGQIASFKPDILDNFNLDAMMRTQAQSNGLAPDMIVDEKDVAKTRQGRQQAQAQQMRASQALAAAQAVSKAGTAPEPGSPGDQLMRMAQGGQG